MKFYYPNINELLARKQFYRQNNLPLEINDLIEEKVLDLMNYEKNRKNLEKVKKICFWEIGAKEKETVLEYSRRMMKELEEREKFFILENNKIPSEALYESTILIDSLSQSKADRLLVAREFIIEMSTKTEIQYQKKTLPIIFFCLTLVISFLYSIIYCELPTTYRIWKSSC